MTFWSLTSYSNFPTDQIFHQFHDIYTELDLHRITSGFHGAFATGVACQQGTITLPNTFFPTCWDLLMLQLLRPGFSNLLWLFSTFHIECPSVLSRFCFWRAGHANRDRSPTDTWSRPFLDFHLLYLLRPILLPSLSWLPGICPSNIPRYFLDLTFKFFFKIFDPNVGMVNIVFKSSIYTSSRTYVRPSIRKSTTLLHHRCIIIICKAKIGIQIIKKGCRFY